MTRGVLQSYIKASPITGRLSYRRRIPAKLRKHFTKPDGSLRGLEWNEKLETKAISVALRKAIKLLASMSECTMNADAVYRWQSLQ